MHLKANGTDLCGIGSYLNIFGIIYVCLSIYL